MKPYREAEIVAALNAALQDNELVVLDVPGLQHLAGWNPNYLHLKASLGWPLSSRRRGGGGSLAALYGPEPDDRPT